MSKNLKIEIEAEDEEGVKTLLDHITKEITIGESYRNIDLEANATVDDRWLVVTEGRYQGRYRWTKLADFV